MVRRSKTNRFDQLNNRERLRALTEYHAALDDLIIAGQRHGLHLSFNSMEFSEASKRLLKVALVAA
jgi:hypothetical protein